MSAYRHGDWKELKGAFVEIRQNDQYVRAGFVEDVMPDSSALWLAADGNNHRQIIESAEGFHVWVKPQELHHKARYRMTGPLLFTEGPRLP
ncbi:hypothetical protein [Pseudarthrobacter enclensis]|uniref:hypothetical protein n=1 Tax=Pseudarthrobacter enclensis TaxID=993070 RepID=UPI003EE01358